MTSLAQPAEDDATGGAKGQESTPLERDAAKRELRQIEVQKRLRFIERLLWGIFLMAALTALFFAKVAIMPLVMGLLLSLMLSPIVRFLSRLGVPEPVSAVSLIATIGIVATVAIWGLSGPVTSLIEQAPEIGRQLRGEMARLSDQLEAVQDATDNVGALTGNGEEAQAVVVERSGWIGWVVGSVAGTGGALIVALIFAMFLLATNEMFRIKIINAFPRFAEKKKALTIVRDIERRISRYLAAITVINAGLGVAIGLAMYAYGMPYPAVWGVAAFLLNFIPYLGGMAGALASGAVAIVTFDSLGYAFVVPATYFLLTSIEGQMITPTLVGRRLELNTPAVFVTVVFWAWLWGIPGALMAVPFLVLLKVICDHVENLSVLGDFLGADIRGTTDSTGNATP